MKTKTFLWMLAILYLPLSHTMAQEAGMKAGLNLTNYLDTEDFISFRPGWHIGGYLSSELKKHNFQVELQASCQRLQDSQNTGKFSMYYSQMFFLYKYGHEDKPVKLLFGPGLGLFIGGSFRSSEQTTMQVNTNFVTEEKVNFTIPLSLGILLDYNQVKIGLRNETDLYSGRDLLNHTNFTLSVYYTRKKKENNL